MTDMKIIKKLSKLIEEEISDSSRYAKMALKYKEDNKNLAATFYTLSLDEAKHANLLHAEVVKIIEDYRKEHGEPPPSMLAVYDYLHEEQIKEMQKAKNYQAMFREG